MGGFESETFEYFKLLIVGGIVELKKHFDEIIHMIHIMMKDSDLQCF